MPMFNWNKESDPIFVPEDAEKPPHERDTIWIRRHKMNYEQKMRVQGASVRVVDGELVRDIGEGILALMEVNIVKWTGPSFQGVPCTPENIGALDPDEPLVALTLTEITKRNPQKESPDPKLPLNDGSTSGGASDSTEENHSS